MPIISIVTIAAVTMILVEIAAPGRNWRKVSGWWTRALLLNAVQVFVVFTAGLTWDRWLNGESLWNGDVLGVTGGALIGYLVITFVYYWWHRMRHEINFLWRWLHQVHHSAQRIEILTSFYKHPFEIFLNSLLSSAILYLVIGLSPEAATLAILITGLAELFYHWNIRTPYWLGFVFQRPESHCIHHKEGWHKNNFSDLPLWDMLFGTFHNPREFKETCGFGPECEPRLAELLRGVDVNKARQRPTLS